VWCAVADYFTHAHSDQSFQHCPEA